MTSSLDSALLKLANQTSLSPEEMTGAMEFIVSGHATDADIERFLILFREKGETAVEITAGARVMRSHALKLSKNYVGLLDTCGTGGDGSHTLNVSTLSAFVACAAGVKVAKHGNRSVSSVSGSADLCELLGVPIDLPVHAIENAIENVGFAFLFAPTFHPAMRFAMAARKKIQGKTIFNILGPLSNPAQVDYQVVGVYDGKLVDIVAQALLELGVKAALVVHGADGLDEISISDKTSVVELKDGRLKKYEISPRDYGIQKASSNTLKCKSKEEYKQMALEVLKGGKGPAHDMVSLNAAAALYIAGKTNSIAEGFKTTKKLLKQDVVRKKLDEIISFSKRMAT